MANRKFAATTELACACLASSISENAQENLKNDAREFIFASFGVNISHNINVKIIENDNENIHLTLPCYESFSDFKTPTSMNEDELSEVSGGEHLMEFTDHVTRAGLDEYNEYRYGSGVGNQILATTETVRNNNNNTYSYKTISSK